MIAEWFVFVLTDRKWQRWALSFTFNMHCVTKGSYISEVIDMEGVGSGVELGRLSFLLYNVTLSKLLTIPIYSNWQAKAELKKYLIESWESHWHKACMWWTHIFISTCVLLLTYVFIRFYISSSPSWWWLLIVHC